MFITDFWICGNSSPGYVYTVASTPRSTKRLPTPLTSDVPITTASGTAGFATAFANVTPVRMIDLPSMRQCQCVNAFSFQRASVTHVTII